MTCQCPDCQKAATIADDIFHERLSHLSETMRMDVAARLEAKVACAWLQPEVAPAFFTHIRNRILTSMANFRDQAAETSLEEQKEQLEKIERREKQSNPIEMLLAMLEGKQ